MTLRSLSKLSCSSKRRKMRKRSLEWKQSGHKSRLKQWAKVKWTLGTRISSKSWMRGWINSSPGLVQYKSIAVNEPKRLLPKINWSASNLGSKVGKQSLIKLDSPVNGHLKPSTQKSSLMKSEISLERFMAHLCASTPLSSVNTCLRTWRKIWLSWQPH